MGFDLGEAGGGDVTGVVFEGVFVVVVVFIVVVVVFCGVGGAFSFVALTWSTDDILA